MGPPGDQVIDRSGRAFIEGHDDVRAKVILNLDERRG
jgi:hypothetical protein